MVDIVGGLTAAKLALDLAKDLRQIDRSVDEATFKLKLADLTAALAETQVALAEARTESIEKNSEIRELREALTSATRGDLCPKCLVGRQKLQKTEKHFYGGLGHYGVEDWTYACDNEACGFEQKKMHDPHGAIPIQARKK